MQSTFNSKRIYFIVLCISLSTIYAITNVNEGASYYHLIISPMIGLILGIAIIGVNTFLTSFNVKELITGSLGLIIGCLISEIIQPVIQLATGSLNNEVGTLTQMTSALFFIYFGIKTVSRAVEEYPIVIPFLKNDTPEQPRKRVLIDGLTLQDTHFIDLAISGLLNSQLILPNSVLKEFEELSESTDEASRLKGRKGLESHKRLENFPDIDLQYTNIDFPDISDTKTKFIAIAREINANILAADITCTGHSTINGIKIINLYTLFSVPKIQTQAGEYINIKIQRYGKEPRQGIGYLDDGTMVVVNGGAEFLGEGIRAQVLSVKQTLSGRMVFCNATEDSIGGLEDPSTSETTLVGSGTQYDSSAKNYFTL